MEPQQDVQNVIQKPGIPKWLLLVCILLSSLIVGGLVFTWQNTKNSDANIEKVVVQKNIPTKEDTNPTTNNVHVLNLETGAEENLNLLSFRGVHLKYPNGQGFSIETHDFLKNTIILTQPHTTGTRMFIYVSDTPPAQMYSEGTKEINGYTFSAVPPTEDMGNGYAYILKRGETYYKFSSLWGPHDENFEQIMSTITITDENFADSAKGTIRVNEYYPLQACNNSTTDNTCDDIKIALEIDLTEAREEEKVVGQFFVRGYLGEKKVGEKLITQNFNPFNGDGGQPYTADQENILTVHTPSNSVLYTGFYLNYDEDVVGTGPGYTLHIKNTPLASDFDGRRVDFYYQKNTQTLDIEFLQ